MQDTRALARAFTSEKSAPFRRRMAEIAADTFFKSLQIPGGTVDTATSRDSDGSGSQQQNYSVNVLKNRRLHFLLASLLSRLQGSPLLMLRVGWTCTTMVCFAVAVAIFRAFAATAHGLLKRKPASVKERLEQTGERFGSWTAGSSNTVPVYACAK